ncbi:MAG: MATE family efflux transporter [Moraxellaceae bacterium]|nr:MATE family efflux transporter [Moraxellaceae bacterium]
MNPGRASKLTLWALSWPLYIETALATLAGTVGLALAGHVSPAAVALLGLSNTLRAVLDRIFRIVSTGTSVLLARSLGSGNTEHAAAYIRSGLASSFWLGAVVMCVLGAMPRVVLQALQLPADLAELAVPFLQVLGGVALLDAVIVTMLACVRAFAHTKLSMHAVTLMNVVHLLVSAWLVLGLFDTPPQGVMSFAWGLLASRVVALLFLCMFWVAALRVLVHVRDLFFLTHAGAHTALRDIVAIGLPSAAEKIVFQLCFLATLSMAASLGTDVLATHAYVSNVGAWIGLGAAALGTATEILVSHHIGAGRFADARRDVAKAIKAGMLITAAGAVIAMVVAPWMIAHQVHDKAVLSLLIVVLGLEILAGFGRCLNMIVLGALRAAGDVRWPVKITVAVNLLLGTLTPWLLAIVLGFGLPGLWIGYVLDQGMRGVVMLMRWKKLGWLRFAADARRRLRPKRAALSHAAEVRAAPPLS